MVIHGDNLHVMRTWPDDHVDLVLGSPPYEDVRSYGVDFNLTGQDWVDWMVERMREMVRVCVGLVAMVVEGKTRGFRWSATPALLMADLHRAGIHLRKPPAFRRVGIPGSGGPDWLRNDYEFIVCCTSGGKLPWSDNTAMGHEPKWAPGGAMSYRLSGGTRVNQWGGEHQVDGRKRDGVRLNKGNRPSHKLHTKRDAEKMREQAYYLPTLANPGNVIDCMVGGGRMGDRLCHENEAPFPEGLAEFFVRSFCPPRGTVCDPFSGSGTTAAVAVRTGRKYIAIDDRKSQVELTKRRLKEVQRELI